MQTEKRQVKLSQDFVPQEETLIGEEIKYKMSSVSSAIFVQNMREESNMEIENNYVGLITWDDDKKIT
jgi:hypothetical protein